MKKYILKNNEIIETNDLLEWAQWFETADRHVAQTEINDVKISTVFLGIDHSFGGGVPVLFETMVFGGELDGEQERYTTQEAAKVGHDEIVSRVKMSMNE